MGSAPVKSANSKNRAGIMSVENLVQKARLLCEQRNVRFTPIRERVFELLASQKGGIGAYDLLDKLKQTEANAKPATVYRAIEFLSEQGFVHKIESTNEFLLCHHFDHTHPSQLLICDQCGSVEELHSEAIQAELIAHATRIGFDISTQTIEAHGLCHECQVE